MQHGRQDTDIKDTTSSGPASVPRVRRGFSPLTVLGVVLLTAGLVCLGWVGWQYFGTNIVSKQKADQEIAALEDSWGQPVTAPTPTGAPAGGEPGPTPMPMPRPEAGRAQWLVRIPALGSDWVWPVVAGIGVDDLARGVGWYPTTAQPGQIGNFALAGHRITHGEPFRRLLELKVGDTVIVETREAVYTYELTSAPGQLTVQDTETWVLDPVPGHDDVTPSQALLTLTTCEDLFHSPDRSVAFGKLVSTEMK